MLTPTELSDLLVEFSGAVSDVVHADGGRVVKFIGDEVMWVTSTPELLAKWPSTSSSTHGRGRPACRYAPDSATAGAGHRRRLLRQPVNLAARLVGGGGAGSDPRRPSDVRDELPDWPAIPLDPLILKGFESPVMAYDLHLSR